MDLVTFIKQKVRTIKLTNLAFAFLFAVIIAYGYTYFIQQNFIRSQLERSLFALDSIPLLALLLVVPLTLLYLIYPRIYPQFRRYRNTPGFIFPDYFILAIAFTAVILKLYHYLIFKTISLLGNFGVLLGYGVFLVIVFYIIAERRYNKERKSKSLQNEPGSAIIRENAYYLELDHPIRTAKQDELDRSIFVDTVVKIIIEYPYKESYVFGMLSEWGDGKSSALYLVDEKLRSVDERIISIYFDPWYFNSQENLIQTFFDTIYQAINRDYFYPDLSRSFKRYRNLLSSTLRQVHFDLDLFPGVNDTIEEQKKKINELLEKINRKIVIFIDDIDRLDPSEMKLVFKLVKLCSNFNYFVYVLSLDKLLVSQTLQKEFETDREYLEKIIQTEMQLPKPHKEALERLFDRQFGNLVNYCRVSLKPEDQNDLAHAYHVHIKYHIHNVRDIKRYFNSLMIHFPPLKDEVNLTEFLLVELLRTRYPKAYEFIYENRAFFMFRWGSEIDIKHFKIEDDERKSVAENILNQYQEADRGLLRQIIYDLFPPVENAIEKHSTSHGDAIQFQTEKRIAHPAYFPKYFSFSVPPREIPDSYIEQLIQELNTCDSDQIKQRLRQEYEHHLQADKLSTFFDKLIVKKKDLNQQTYYPIIKSICENADFFPDEKGVFLDSDQDRARALLFVIADFYTNTDEAQNLLLKAINEAKTDSFSGTIVLFAGPDRNRIFSRFEHINLDALQEAFQKRMHARYIEGGADIFQEESNHSGFLLRQWHDRETVNAYVSSLLKQHPEYIGRLLARFVAVWEGGHREWEFGYKGLQEIFNPQMIYEAVQAAGNWKPTDNKEQYAVEEFLRCYQQNNN